jgi:integrase
MQKQLLTELIHELEQEMLKLGYRNMKFYRRRWKRLLQFAQEQGEMFYSEHLGMDFIAKHFHILETDLNRTLSKSEISKLRIIRMLGDFQLHRVISRRYYKHKKILTNPCFMVIKNQFKSYCEDKGYSKITIEYRVNEAVRFMDYLDSQNVSFKEINLPLIHDYIKTLSGYTCGTVSQNICSIRAFFHFLLEIGEVQIDFSEKTPMVSLRRQTRIPSVWTADELKKLLAAIDRGSPKGKRDYAIILLACCLGMRCIDIKHLKISDLHWEEKKIVFIQSKTKTPISLPLTQEVGWAVIDYLKYGRPKVDIPWLFIRHVAPFCPFSEGSHLAGMIKWYMRVADIPKFEKKRGMHSFRHTLASVLLENDTSLSTISDILGHIDTDSTAVYLKIDTKKLKECALTFGDTVNHE